MRKVTVEDYLRKTSPMVWHGDFGVYEVPERFRGMRFRKDGWPHKSDPLYGDLLVWAADEDAKALEMLREDEGVGNGVA